MTLNDKIDIKRNRIYFEFPITRNIKCILCIGVPALENMVDRVINNNDE